MLIKPSEGAAAAGLPSTRPAPAGQLALEAKTSSVSIALSASVRALAAALTREQLDLRDLQLGGKLTGADLLLLAKLSELASTELLDPSEVVKLALDLSRYRAPAEAPGPQPTALLALPAFSTRDESLARSILSSVALHSTALERGFVRALLDPDQTPEHAVDFEFLRRAVVALSAAPRDAAPDASVTFERRDARAALARALQALALPRAALPDAARHAALGADLLRLRLPAVLGASGSVAAGAQPRRAALTREDRGLLGVLYAAAQLRAQDLEAVDDVARALVRLRALERADTSAQAELREPDRANLAAQTERSEPRPVSAQTATSKPQPATGKPQPADVSAQAALEVTERAEARAPRDGFPLGRSNAPVPPATTAHTADAAATAVTASDALEEQSSPLARSFGSATQLAARADGTYRSLAPPALLWADAGRGEHTALPAALVAQRTSPALRVAPGALDVAGALGLSSLVRDVRAQALRAARARLPARRTDMVRGVAAPAETASEADADDPVLEGSSRRKHVRWRFLMSRRRRARSQHRRPR